MKNFEKFKKLNESELPYHLEEQLNDFEEDINGWLMDNEDWANEKFIAGLENLKDIVLSYKNWLDDNKDEIGDSEINLSINSFWMMDWLTYDSEKIDKLIELLNDLPF